MTVNIKSEFQQIDNIKGFNCNSWKKHSSWIRAIKLMNNLIPTLDILQVRYPDIITHIKCLFCNEKRNSYFILLSVIIWTTHGTQ